jgi:hypothetical protein
MPFLNGAGLSSRSTTRKRLAGDEILVSAWTRFDDDRWRGRGSSTDCRTARPWSAGVGRVGREVRGSGDRRAGSVFGAGAARLGRLALSARACRNRRRLDRQAAPAMRVGVGRRAAAARPAVVGEVSASLRHARVRGPQVRLPVGFDTHRDQKRSASPRDTAPSSRRKACATSSASGSERARRCLAGARAEDDAVMRILRSAVFCLYEGLRYFGADTRSPARVGRLHSVPSERTRAVGAESARAVEGRPA